MNPIGNPLAWIRSASMKRAVLAAWAGTTLVGTSPTGVQAQTLVSGAINQNTTWTLNNSPYRVTGSVTVNAGATLTVEAGVRVEFAQYQGLHVDGALRVLGTAAAAVVFTGTAETAGWWTGIVVRNAGSAAFEQARVVYAGYWHKAGVLKMGTGDLTLRRTRIEHTDGAGLHLEAGYGRFMFEENRFAHNVQGVRVGINASFLDDDATEYVRNGADVSLNGGTITEAVAWYLNPAFSMQVSATVMVGAEGRLRILPGTVVKFAQYQELVVDGTLEAVGTAVAPIHFTDWRDDAVGGDANGDGAETVPAPGWWRAIVVRNAGSATLDHSRVAYGGYWHGAGILKTGPGELILRRTTIERTDGAGLYLQAGYGRLVFEHNRFAHNAQGVRVGINASFLDDDATQYAGNGADVSLNGGTITEAVSWYLNPACSMQVSGSVTVGAEGRLRILPGTVVKFAQFQELIVDGTLEAVGTALAPIHFTDWRDDAVGGDANGDGEETVPAPGWWRAIVVRNAGSATLDHSRLAWAGYWHRAGILKTGPGELILRRTTIEHTDGAGLYLHAGYGRLVFEHNRFAHNTRGVQVGINASFLDDDATEYVRNGADVSLNGGTITEAVAWYLNPAFSMQVSATVMVGAEGRLQILPGTVVKFAQYQELVVDGTLEAIGTATAPIHFTDWRDDAVGGDANGDGDETVPEPGWWRAIVVRNAGSATFEHSRVAYGGYWHVAGLLKTGPGDLTLRRTTIEHTGGAGLYLQAGYGRLVFEENRFAHNTQGVRVGINASFLDDDATEYAGNGADVALNGGTITEAVSWYLNPAFSMQVSGSVTVGGEGRLRILPGTVVKFAQFQELIVDGTLEAVGTALAPIHFTDWRDDTVGGDANRDGEETVPAPGWWRAIVVRNAGSARLERARVAHAGYWHGAGIFKMGTGDLTARRTTIHRTLGDGLRLDNSSGAHSLERNTLAENRVGVSVRNQAQPVVLTANLIQDNADFGVRNQGSSEVDARGNWWGDATGPRHATRNPEGQGDAVSDGVLFEPCRTTPSAGEIRSPVRSGTLVAGDWLRFSGSPLVEPGATCRWSLSDGRVWSVRDPGLINFPQADNVIVSYSVGADGGEDPHPDTRVFSVVANSGQLPDLRVTGVRVSGTLTVGQPARVEYTVRNVGQGPAGPGWRDAVHLSRDALLDIDDLYLGSAVVDRGLAAGQSYQGVIPVSLPVVDEGAYHLILVVNHEWQVLELHRLNNEYATQITAEVPTLVEGMARVVPHDAGRVEHYFRMTATPGQNLLLDLSGVSPEFEVFIRFGALPTRGAFEHHLRGGERFVIPAATPGDWYLLVHGDRSEAGTYSLEFSLADLILSHSAPSRHGTLTDLELTLAGAGFLSPLGVELVSVQGTSHPAGAVEVDSPTRARATFTAGTVPPGTYAVRVYRNGRSAGLAGALEIVAGGRGNLEVQLVLPPRFGYHILATVFVEYANTGEAAMPAPLILVTATQNGRSGAILTLDQTRLNSGFWTSAMPEGFADAVQFLASGATPGILQPGESKRVPVYFAGWRQPWDFSYPPIEWLVGVLDAEERTLVDWAGLKNELRPDYVREDAWNIVWNNFTALAGETWGDYLAMLSRNAAYLDRHGQRLGNLEALQAFTFRQAEGFSPLPNLASGVDAIVQTPGPALVFERSYPPLISRRFELGPLGRGWTHNWQLALHPAQDNSVKITDRTGTPRLFQPDRRYPGRFLSQPGDRGELRTVPGGYRLTEPDGTLLHFGSDGRLSSLEDPNGNGITCAYTGDLLTGLTHSAGPALTFAYHGDGRLAAVTDPHGRETRYTYSGEHLTSFYSYDGRLTSYGYHTAAGAARHALERIGLPDGTTRTYTYDARGRLSGNHRDDQQERVTFTHAGLGQVQVTDALGHSTSLFFDHWGRLCRTENALGEAVQRIYDSQGNLVAVTDPAGFRTTLGYDLQGNLTEVTDALRRVTRFSHTRAFNRLGSVTDAANQRTDYAYDSRGNLREKRHPDGRLESWTFDARGNPLTWTNRRGDSLAYEYDSVGRIRRRTLADGSQAVYRYDDRGNLVAAEDERGTTTFTYNAADYLVRVDYPGNRWLQFEHDAIGRRTSSEDQLGHRIRYHYDPAGRLSRMSDGTGDLVVYAYDELSRLVRKTLGNGVYTVYTHDPAGRLRQMVNHAPDGQVLSRFVHTHDRRGRPVALETHYGVWTYAYDDVGQLIRAQLRSTDPDIPDQDLAYAYDAVGNRVRTTVNGRDETWASDRLNQYTRAGNRTYTYDLDGNLVREQGADGSTVYTYNQQNRLIGVTRGGDTWQFTYDALGNRVAVDENGAVTHYVYDPVGLGNLVGEYDAAGNLKARYTHGFGLIHRTAAGVTDFYTYDPIGNTSELSDLGGAARAAHAWRPFGEGLLAGGSVSSPFQFMGEFGVVTDPTGLLHVRARQYDPRTGRFTTQDPIGFLGGDLNLYRYALNAPIHASDPTGMTTVGVAFCGIGRGAFNLYGGAKTAILGTGLAATGVGIPLAVPAYISTAQSIIYGVAELGLNLGWLVGYHGLGVGNECDYMRFQEALETSPVEEVLVSQGYSRRQIKQTRFYLGFLGVGWDAWEIAKHVGAEPVHQFFCGYNREEQQRIRGCPPRFGSSRQAAREAGLARPVLGATSCVPFRAVISGGAGLAASHDPNEKLAVGGHGERNFLAMGALIRYQIDFENLESATAPAQIVTIRDPLPAELDLATFEIAEVGFGEVILQVGQGRRYFEALVEYPYADDDYDFVVDVQVEVWLEDGILHANFITLDPATGLPPPDVGVGFLPPENETGRGQGYVAYHVRTKETLISGAAIRNIATIQFDFGLEIDTNQIDPLDKGKGTDPDKEALVTIDAVPPSSRVHALPVESPPEFVVSWSGTDDASGIREYNVYVARGEAAYEPWLRSTPLTSARFDGLAGHTYRFYCQAVDNAGNREVKAPVTEAVTTVSLAPPPLRIIGAGWAGNSFAVLVTTEPARTYALESSDPVDGPDWITVDQIIGDGTIQTLLDPRPPTTARFYRVRAD